MIRAILTDIEGTTSSLSFVKDVLFPYSRERMVDFVEQHRDDPEVAKLLDEVRALAGADLSPGEVGAQLVAWIDQDLKLAPLKALQGLIWEAGYRRGDFQGHIYEDAARHLKAWRVKGLELYVFSSGSVQAQKLLFAHTQYGDLTPLFSGYFDTRTGAKQDPESYRAIARQISQAPQAVLFLSDSEAELDAARSAGFATCRLVRDPGDHPASRHPLARNFDQVILGTCGA